MCFLLLGSTSSDHEERGPELFSCKLILKKISTIKAISIVRASSKPYLRPSSFLLFAK